MSRLFMLVVMSLTLATPAKADAGDQPFPTIPANEVAALDQAVTDLCGKQVALLGEAAHGEGHTEAFKIALVRRLVMQCHFRAVIFEASQYDFIEIGRRQRTGQPVTADMLSSAIGGVWKFDREFQPLVPFLLREMTAGRLTIGGLDGQLGSYQAFYSNDAMPDELTGYLSGARRVRCRALFRGQVYGFAAGDADASDARATLRGCVAEVDRAVAAEAALTAIRRAELRRMLATIDQFLIPDPNDSTVYSVARDRAMYRNFRWFADRLPRPAKIIVWAANLHIAKDPGFDPVFAGAANFGSFVRRDYGGRAFALGITALHGSYRRTKKDYRELAAAPPNSLEARAMRGSDAGAAYLSRRSIVRLDTVPGALNRHQYVTFDWSKAFDGVIVLRAEYPPHSTRPGYF